MIKEIKEYIVECDICFDTYNNPDINDKVLLLKWLQKEGWILDSNKFICPECKHEYIKNKESFHK
jgi:hypothetical protein